MYRDPESDLSWTLKKSASLDRTAAALETTSRKRCKYIESKDAAGKLLVCRQIVGFDLR